MPTDCVKRWEEEVRNCDTEQQCTDAGKQRKDTHRGSLAIVMFFVYGTLGAIICVAYNLVRTLSATSYRRAGSVRCARPHNRYLAYPCLPKGHSRAGACSIRISDIPRCSQLST